MQLLIYLNKFAQVWENWTWEIFNLAKNLCKLRETDRKSQHVGNLGLTYFNENTLLFQIFIFPIHRVETMILTVIIAQVSERFISKYRCTYIF